VIGGVPHEAPPELDALGVRVEAGIDVSGSCGPIARTREAARDGVEIDVLINNAGVLQSAKISIAMDFRRRRAAIGSECARAVARDRGAACRCSAMTAAKVVITTSRMGSMADNGSGGYYGYRMSKAAVNAAGVSLAHDLKGSRHRRWRFSIPAWWRRR
jgi:short-subunit dehydrogenase